MSESVSVIIPVFGDRKFWQPLADRAMRSAMEQTHEPNRVIVHYADSLSLARNVPANFVKTDWLCFLDADDELDPAYLQEALMLRGGDVRYPKVGIVRDGHRGEPTSYHPVDLLQMNYVVVSALVRRELFIRAGGFRELPFYEDWDLWLRCRRLGATIVHSPGSTLWVHQRPNSRNVVPQDKALAFGEEMRRLYGHAGKVETMV